MEKNNLFLLFLLLSTAVSCSKQVNRISVNRKIDLSGRFNDVDSAAISKNIVKQIINECYDFNNGPRESRVVAIGEIKNKSHEHINVSTFMNDIERSLVNSGKCCVVANRQIRNSIQEEMSDYSCNNLEAQKKCATKLGVNRMIFGEISTIVDREGKKEVKLYQFDIELIDINTNEKLWMGTHKIKKYIKD